MDNLNSSKSGAGLRGDSERLLIKPRILSHSETTASNLALLFNITYDILNT